jgi:hypothetical protein
MPRGKDMVIKSSKLGNEISLQASSSKGFGYLQKDIDGYLPKLKRDSKFIALQEILFF